MSKKERGIALEEIKNRIKHYKEEMIEDLEKLVSIPSIRNSSSSSRDAPFGQDIREAFDEFIKIGERSGFKVQEFDGYACHIEYGEQREYVGALGHLDVVSAGDHALWDSDPFTLTQRNGLLFGRGVNDDKGPLLAAFYALKIIKDMEIPLGYSIRIIAGGAEETTWECMDHYFKNNEQPVMGFSPDGNFPIVNGEKGILQFHVNFSNQKTKKHHVISKVHCTEERNFVCDFVEIQMDHVEEAVLRPYLLSADEVQIKNNSARIIYRGERSLSRNPQRGKNALWKLAKDLQDFPFSQVGMNQLLHYIDKYFINDFYGIKLGIHFEDEEMGSTSICPMSITLDESHFNLNVDYRYPKGVHKDQVISHLKKQASQYQGEVIPFNEKNLLFVQEDSPLIVALKKAYQTVVREEAEVLTKGGASYARTLKNGVAFGATFEGEDPKPHMPNEQMPVESLLKACEIYVHAFIELAGK